MTDSFAPFERASRRARDLVYPMLLLATFRVMALLVMNLRGYLLPWSDYYNYLREGALAEAGYYPYLHFWMEYPPLFPWVNVVAQRVSLWLPGIDPDFWFRVVLGLGLLAVDLGNLWLIYAIVAAIDGADEARQRVWWYALLFGPFFFWTHSFDVLVLFFLLLAVYALVRRRPWLAGLAVGLGFLTKVIPIIALPVGVWALSRSAGQAAAVSESRPGCAWRSVAAFAGTALGVVAAVLVPLWLASPSLTAASFQNMLSRPSWQTIWAALEGYYGWGVMVPVQERFDPASALIASHPTTLPWLWITAAFAFGYLLLFGIAVGRVRPSPRGVVAFAGLSLSVFLLYSKGYSSQFIVYPLTFVVVLLGSGRGIAYVILLSVVGVLEWPLTFGLLGTDASILGVIFALRTALWLALVVEYAAQLFVPTPSVALKRLLRSLPVVIAIGIGITVVIVFQAYAASVYATSPYRELVDWLRARPVERVVTTSSALYRRAFPFLGARNPLVLVSADPPSLVEERLRAVATSPELWLVYDGVAGCDTVDNARVEAWLETEAGWFFIEDALRGDVRVMRYAAPVSLTTMPQDAVFGDSLQLTALGLPSNPPMVGEPLRFTSHWRALRPMAADWTVSIRVLDDRGRVVGQQDRQLGTHLHPTSAWSDGEGFVQRHATLPLPAAGRYAVEIALYRWDSGERLTVAVPGQPPPTVLRVATVVVAE